MVTRVGGLASGMDIDELVKKLMTAEKAPLNKLNQNKTTYEWQRDAYRSVNTKLKTFDTYISDNLVLKSFTSKTAASSNSSLVSAVASGSATGTLSIEGVSQLATAARGIGTQINANGQTKLSTYLASQSPSQSLPNSIKLSSIDKNGKMGEAVTLDLTADMTIDQFVSKINSSASGVSAIFEGGRLSITAKNTGSEVNGNAAIQTNDKGNELFKTLGLSSLVTEQGKNAIFQVNGIATERTTNNFSINGYSVTLNSTFNTDQAKAEKYNAALKEWQNTTSSEFTTAKATAEAAKNTATSTYNTAQTNYNDTKKTLFGTEPVSSQETSVFNKVHSNLTPEDKTKVNNTQAFTSKEDYENWLEVPTNEDLSKKLKAANVSFEEFNALKTIDAGKIETIQKQKAFDELGSSFINGLTDNEKALILGVQGSSTTKTLADFNAQIDTWKSSGDETQKKLGKKLSSLNDSQKTNLFNLSSTELQQYTNQADYNTLGSAFLGNLKPQEKTLLNNSGTGFTKETLNTKISQWEESGSQEEKDFAKKLAALNDTQKETLVSLTNTELTAFSNLGEAEVAMQNALKDKNAKESEYNQLSERQNKAKVAFEAALGSTIPTDDSGDIKLSDLQSSGGKPVQPGSTTPVTMTATTNVDEMVTKVKEFITTYNGLIKDLSDQTKQSKYRDYTPLTAEQKEDMSENEIKLWEEKAKSGLLRNDSIIRNGLSNMRSLVYQTNHSIEDTRFNSLYSIGITTSSTNYNDGGTLEIDEAKLRKALEENPDAVEKLLKNSSGKKDDTVQVMEKGKLVTKTEDTRGYFDKLRESMKSFEINIEKKAGRSTMTDAQYTIGKNLTDVEKRITSWQSKLEDIEARYWKQFTAMETAINKANSQSSLFSS